MSGSPPVFVIFCCPPSLPPIIYAEPSHATSTISIINPKAQPRTDAGNEALGRVGFGLEKQYLLAKLTMVSWQR